MNKFVLYQQLQLDRQRASSWRASRYTHQVQERAKVEARARQVANKDHKSHIKTRKDRDQASRKKRAKKARDAGREEAAATVAAADAMDQSQETPSPQQHPLGSPRAAQSHSTPQPMGEY
jgi:hypothetical protein